MKRCNVCDSFVKSEERYVLDGGPGAKAVIYCPYCKPREASQIQFIRLLTLFTKLFQRKKWAILKKVLGEFHEDFSIYQKN